MAFSAEGVTEAGPGTGSTAFCEEILKAELASSKDISTRALPMEGVVVGTHPKEPSCPSRRESEHLEGKQIEVGAENAELCAAGGLGTESERAVQPAEDVVASMKSECRMEEATSNGGDVEARGGDNIQERQNRDSDLQQLREAGQDARDQGKRGSIHDRLGGKGADSSDWRKGKRGRDNTESEELSERSDWRDSSHGSKGDAGRKRRKSGDLKPALPLSPEEKRFRMGAIDETRGSPKVGRDRRRERYQPPRVVNEEDQKATLYVGDIEQATSKRDLRYAFQRFGEIKEAKMITNQCYGFVTFRLRSDAETALASSSSVKILGRKPYVSWAQGAMPAWKIGVGGFVMDPSSGIVDKRDALTKAAEVAAGVAAAAVRAKQKAYEDNVQSGAGGRCLVAYDDL